MLLKKKAQSIVEYTLIASVVVAAMILVASALKSKLTTHYKEKAEATVENNYKDKMDSTVENAVDSMDVGVFSEEE